MAPQNTPAKPDELSAHRKAEIELDYQIRASRPLIYICTHEETRVMNALAALAERDKKWTILSWDVADGLKAITSYANLPDGYQDAAAVLDWFQDVDGFESGYLVLVMKDFQKLLGSEGNPRMYEFQVTRKIRNLCELFLREKKAMIIIGSSLFLPEEIEKTAAIIDWPLPEPSDIKEKIESVLTYTRQSNKMTRFKVEYTEPELADIVQAFRGLTMNEIELIITYMMIAYASLDSVAIASKKRDTIRKAGVLDWIEPQYDMSSVGGLHELKRWLASREKAFTKEAIDYGLPANPKGLILVGVQGGGKSLVARAIASAYGLPLLRLDIGKVYSSLVGSSEERIRSAIKIAEAVSPCILWIDELEKGLAGVSSSDHTDGGTSARVFGSLLTWMQEKEAPVFIVATANDVSQLPPELLRKGRFDEVFFVDLPAFEDRKDIFKIHIGKYNRIPEDFDIDKLAHAAKAFTGAEIEAAIVAAMYESFNENREVDTEDIEQAVAEIVPLAVTMKERIDALRAWAETRARNASIIEPNINKKTKTVTDTTSSLMANIDLDSGEEEL